MNLLAKKIIRKLTLKRLNISLAESCTGGLLSFTLAKLPGASKVYLAGLITYSNNSKKKLLKVPKNILEKYGAVSHEVCVAMVKNLYKISKTDLSVSITGVAGPSGGTLLKPVGLVYIGVKFKKKVICKRFLIKNRNRNYIQKDAVKKALNLIYKLI